MNIFTTHKCPKQCAINLDNSRVIKMILESCQMLSTNVRHYKYKLLANNTNKKLPIIIDSLYAQTHFNHPCTIWARKSLQNFTWLKRHTAHLIAEHKHRYPNSPMHKSLKILNRVHAIDMSKVLPSLGLTPFANATPLKKYKDILKAYQDTMTLKWIDDTIAGRPPRWNNRPVPEFYKKAS